MNRFSHGYHGQRYCSWARMHDDDGGVAQDGGHPPNNRELKREDFSRRRRGEIREGPGRRRKKIVAVILLKIYVDQHTKRQGYKMKVVNMFIIAVCVIFLIKLRWPKTKSLYDTVNEL